MLLTRWVYYLSSIFTILLGMKSWMMVAAAFLNLPIRKPFFFFFRNGCRFKATSAMDIWIIKETCLDGDYERNETIQNGWTIIDLGAYLGGFSVSIARKHKDCIVYAYEPSSHSFALLQENTNLNKTHNVKTFPYAVGSTSGLSSLYIASETAVKHSTAKASDEKEQKKIEVKVVTLDQIFEELQIHRCDFLKIDCEGAEYDILFRTCAETLHKIRYISMEYHNNVTSFSHEDLVVYLQNKGFAVKTYPNLAHPRDLGFLYAKNAHWT